MDRAKVEAFLETFTSLAAGATTIGLLAIADRCGLSAWLGEHGGGTSAGVAAGAALEERYVREILSGLAAAGVVEYEAAESVFHLPPEHALFISSELSPYFMGGWLDMVPAAMTHIDAIADAAVQGGGVTFEQFGEAMIRGLERVNGPSQRVFLTSRWLPGIPGLEDRLHAGIDVADVGCGAGTAAALMAMAYPRSAVTGFDVHPASVERARALYPDLPNLEFEIAAAEDLPADSQFDLITTFDVIHDLADPLAALVRIHDALSPEGRYLMMEPNTGSNLEDNLHARGALLYGVSVLHCMTQSLAQGGAGLGTAWGRERAEGMAGEAGFTLFEHLEGISNRFSAFYLLSR